MIYQHERKTESWRSICAYNLAWLSFSLMVPFNFQLLSQPHLIISSSAASDMLKIIYLLHHWGQWRERYEWTFREINNKKKNRHSQHLQIKTAGCFLHYYISNTEWNASQWKKKKWINILSYLTWVFFSFYLFLHAGFISTLKSIYQTFRSGRLAINSLRGGMWKNKNLSKI